MTTKSPDVFRIARDPMRAVLIDGIDAEAAGDIAALHYAVCRSITCPGCGSILDTRTAALVLHADGTPAGGRFSVLDPGCASTVRDAIASGTMPQLAACKVETAADMLAR